MNMINTKTDKDVEPVSSLTKNVTLKNDSISVPSTK
jgi:hypothetical protein